VGETEREEIKTGSEGGRSNERRKAKGAAGKREGKEKNELNTAVKVSGECREGKRNKEGNQKGQGKEGRKS